MYFSFSNRGRSFANVTISSPVSSIFYCFFFLLIACWLLHFQQNDIFGIFLLLWTIKNNSKLSMTHLSSFNIIPTFYLLSIYHVSTFYLYFIYNLHFFYLPPRYPVPTFCFPSTYLFLPSTHLLLTWAVSTIQNVLVLPNVPTYLNTSDWWGSRDCCKPIRMLDK